MREILFRGKRIDNGDFVEGHLYGIWDKKYILWGQTNHVPNGEEVIPETVGQFTGLTDKNGVKIFEGDVVFAGYGEYYQGTHEHSTTIIIDMSNYDALNALCNANVAEVIGNIHSQKGDV